VIVARSPLRISFAGGGSDLSPFVDIYGGSVLNATIDRYAYCTVEPADEFSTNAPDIVNPCVDFVLGQLPNIRVSIHSETEQGSGLGGSSAVVVACMKALGYPGTQQELAEDAIYVERNLCGFPGGKQDQFATAFGGFNYIEFDADGTNTVSPISLSYENQRRLQYSLVLYNIGVSRTNNTVLERNIEGLKNDTAMIEHTKDLVQNCSETLQYLVTGNLKKLAHSFEKNWEIKAGLHSGITSNPFAEVKQVGCANGALSAKICGAGGGGHLLFVVDPAQRHKVIEALKPLPGHVEYFYFTDKGCESWTQ